MTHVQTDLNGRVDPTEMLDQMLATWDDQAYETALAELEDEIEETAGWLAVLAEQKAPITTANIEAFRRDFTRRIAAVRNADQTRTDNQKAALT
jgi:hypothetical protein